MANPILSIFKKECLDILRDTRALLTVSLVSIMAGPIVLLMLANMLSNFETKSERRMIVVSGIEHAPSLANHLLRETAQINPAPDNYNTLVEKGKLSDPVLEIPSDFEQRISQGQTVQLKLLTNSGNAQAQASVPRVRRWLESFAREHTGLYLAVQGIAPNIANIIELEEIDFANPKAESVKIFGMLPYFFVFAALYGVWSASLETTVGEKERNTAEALLITPIKMYQLVVGKWLAVFCIGSAVTCSVIIGFVPTQAMIESDTLRAMFNYGWYEVLICMTLLIPLTGLFAAMLMAIGYHANTTRQAQANATALMLCVAFLPMLVSLNSQSADWHIWAPVISQHTHILEMLKGNSLKISEIGISVLAAVALQSLLLWKCITAGKR
jgi:sodium transport system permease protein